MYIDLAHAIRTHAPDVNTRLFALAMMEAWANAGPPQRQRRAQPVDAANTAAGFVCAAARLKMLLPEDAYPSGWTYSDVNDCVCRPFGEWVAASRFDDVWPVRPVWSHWLQGRVEAQGFAVESPCYRRYVVTYALVVPVTGHDDAIRLVSDLMRNEVDLSERNGTTQFRQYWILSGPELEFDRSCGWYVQLATEGNWTSASGAGILFGQLLLQSTFAEHGIFWSPCSPAGSVLAEGEFGITSAASPAACPPSSPSAFAGGLLPPRWR